ncbi:MAG: class I SAM-dependent methyltransferase [Chloroflexota bacterium]|nr:class I SAM-dependent methyltransferase [Chloroflexota bacterium]
MGRSGATDIWASGEAYEPYVGRWSRIVAREFLAWLAVPPGGRWLDVGCGTGALSRIILEMASPSEVLGVDPSVEYVAYAEAHTPDPHARFTVGDAQALPVLSTAYDAVVAGLVLNFVPDPAAAVAEMTRAARRSGGVVGAYVWDYAGGMGMMRRFWDAAAALDPAARELDEGPRFNSECRPEALADLFGDAGLRNVEARAVDVPTVFRDFDDYWLPFLGGQGPAASYASALSVERRDVLRERIRAELPVAADGSIPLAARAWAVRGER